MRALLFLALTLFGFVESQQPPQPPIGASPPPCLNQQNLVVLGDSLSSIDPTSLIYNGPRHTNGLTWNEYLVNQFRAAQTLVNVAAAGAVAYPGYRNQPVPPCEEKNKYLSLQVTSLLNQTNQTIPPNTCIAIWIGANDVKNVSAAVLNAPSTIGAVLTNIQGAILQAVQTLIQAGGKCFWMFNQFQFAAYPVNNALNPNVLNTLTTLYNNAFAQALNQTWPAGVSVRIIDAALALTHVTSNFTYANYSYGSATCTTSPPKCGAMNYSCPGYFWLDDNHPTTVAHQALAAEFYQQMQGFICPPPPPVSPMPPVLLPNATDADRINYMAQKYGVTNVGSVNAITQMTDAQRLALVQAITVTETIVLSNMVVSYVNVASQASGFTMSLPSGGSGVTSFDVSDFGAGVVACVITGVPATADAGASSGLVTPTVSAGESLAFVYNIDRLDASGIIIHTVPYTFKVPRNGKGKLKAYTHSCASSNCANVVGVQDGEVTLDTLVFIVKLLHTSGVSGVAAPTDSPSPSPMDNTPGPGSSSGLYGLFALLILPFIALPLCFWGYKQLKAKPKAKEEALYGPMDPFGMPTGYPQGAPMPMAPQPMEFTTLAYDKPMSSFSPLPSYMP